MQKKTTKEVFISYLLVIFGSALFAVGDVMFVNPYRLAPGGTYGLANVFNTVWPWRISYYAICMDIPLLLIGTWVLGPRFGIKTVLSTILIFCFTWVLESVWGYLPVVHIGDIIYTKPTDMVSYMEVPHGGAWFVPDYVVNTVVAGVIYGLAIGLIFKSGATSGGSDIISMILHKYTKISLGTLTLIVDGCITLTSFVAFKQIRLPIYSIMVIVIESYMIDLIVDGLKTYKTVFIVTDEYENVRQFIINDLERGGTCLTGAGLYQGVERKMIYATMGRSDLVKLKANLRLIDPNSFVNVIDSSEIMGFGFKALPEEE
jgi:uncharacterized membrane-anchored protein YitT (DUF2179 family)